MSANRHAHTLLVGAEIGTTVLVGTLGTSISNEHTHTHPDTYGHPPVTKAPLQLREKPDRKPAEADVEPGAVVTAQLVLLIGDSESPRKGQHASGPLVSKSGGAGYSSDSTVSHCLNRNEALAFGGVGLSCLGRLTCTESQR